ncbi:MAG: group II intron maturase-specific domain-containing protein [Crocosphaera sp.]
MLYKKRAKTLSEMKARTQEDVIRKVNPLLRRFANYYRGYTKLYINVYINANIIVNFHVL